MNRFHVQTAKEKVLAAVRLRELQKLLSRKLDDNVNVSTRF